MAIVKTIFNGYSLFINTETGSVRYNSAAIKKILWRKNPYCTYCGIHTYLLDFYNFPNKNKVKNPPEDLATLEHVYSKYNPERNIDYNRYKFVLSCRLCNDYRSVYETENIPIEELHRRSGRYPTKAKIDVINEEVENDKSY